MSADQREAYEGADRIKSDPIGILDRDNRNHAKKLRLIEEHMAATWGDDILEVGCGGGIHAERLARRYNYLGIDISPSLVARTNERLTRGSAIVTDARDIPLPDNAVSSVIGTAVLHHLPDAGAALDEWGRVAAETVTVCEPNYLFPKDLLSAHITAHERHKTQLAPWRIRSTLADLDVADWTLKPAIYTPPWPAALTGLWDRVDAAASDLPVGRWISQTLLIHLEL